MGGGFAPRAAREPAEREGGSRACAASSSRGCGAARAEGKSRPPAGRPAAWAARASGRAGRARGITGHVVRQLSTEAQQAPPDRGGPRSEEEEEEEEGQEKGVRQLSSPEWSLGNDPLEAAPGCAAGHIWSAEQERANGPIDRLQDNGTTNALRHAPPIAMEKRPQYAAIKADAKSCFSEHATHLTPNSLICALRSFSDHVEKSSCCTHVCSSCTLLSDKNLSASRAAIEPEPADVIACR
mmetsp:Transcript_74599/g.201806  ORF Transcript_74599/g.201806 Transcript_74599/m.201806 type:complete len:240 (+) Transcript_74599:60-779(+)